MMNELVSEKSAKAHYDYKSGEFSEEFKKVLANKSVHYNAYSVCLTLKSRSHLEILHSLLSELCINEYPPAFFLMGWLYEHGLFTGQDENYFIRYFRAGKKLGHLPSSFKLFQISLRKNWLAPISFILIVIVKVWVTLHALLLVTFSIQGDRIRTFS